MTHSVAMVHLLTTFSETDPLCLSRAHKFVRMQSVHMVQSVDIITQNGRIPTIDQFPQLEAVS